MSTVCSSQYYNASLVLHLFVSDVCGGGRVGGAGMMGVGGGWLTHVWF